MFTLMKPLLGLFAMLFCLVSIGGIGQITSDPDQNSTTISADISAPEMAIVVNQTPVLIETFSVAYGDGELDVKRYTQDGCEYLIFGEVRALSNEEMFVLSEHVKQPNGFNYKSRNANPTEYITQTNPGGVLSIFYN